MCLFERHFFTKNYSKENSGIIADIQKLIDHDISEISVQTIFDELGKYDTIVSELVNKFLNDNSQYHIGGCENEEQLSDYFCDQTGRKCRKELKMYKKEIDWDEMSSQDIHLDGLMTNPEMLLATNYNVLGIGSYKNHKYTFSRIEDKLEYVEDGDTYTPKWLCSYDKKDWPMKKLVADFYKFLENTIGDPPDGVIFDFSSEVVQQDEDDSKKKKVIRRLIPTYKWLIDKDVPFITIEKYIAKLKNIL